MIQKKYLLIFILNEVYYWEPFYKILVNDLKITDIVVEINSKRSYSKLFDAVVPHANDTYCQKTFLPKNYLNKIIEAFKIIRKFKGANILITQYISFFNLFCLILARIYAKKVFFKGEAIILPNEKIGLKKYIYLKFFLSLCDEIFYSCEGNKSLFLRLTSSRKLFSMPCFSVPTRSDCIKSTNDYFFENKINIVLCGAFYSIKNFGVITKLLQQCPDLIDQVHIHLIGSGKTKFEIENKLKYLKVKYTSHGFINPEEVAKLMKKFGDILFLPSFRDNSPKVLNEAMQVGLAVLVSKNCGTTLDLVKEGVNGYSFYPDDIEAMSKILQSLTKERQKILRMGSNSRYIVRNSTPKNAVLSILKRLVSY